MSRGVLNNSKFMSKKDASKYVGLPIGSLRIMILRGSVKTEMLGKMEVIPLSEANKLKAELDERRKLRIKPEDWNYSGVNF